MKTAKPVSLASAVISPWTWTGQRGEMAVAEIRGGILAPQIRGSVLFEDIPDGVWIVAQISGLPSYRPAESGQAPVGPHGFHIHEFGDCTPGTPENPFPATGDHFNPAGEPHGNHAGDFPVLFSNHGKSLMGFFTDKFKVADVVGRSVIIHENPDDYRTQPTGASGKKLACGMIVRI